MKKKLFYYLFAVLCTATLFTSCSDDDDNGKNGDDQTEVTDISGSYKGNLVVPIDGSAADPVSQVISIAKSGDQTSQVILSLKKFSFAGRLVGDIEVPCTVEEKDGVQSFSGQKDLKFTTEFGQMLGTLPTSVSGTVRDGKVSMKIGVTVAALGQTVDVAFEGDKMSGNESGEAKILSFTFDLENEANACVIGHPVINEDNTITFDVDQAMVDANPDLLKGLVPTFAYSEKATCVLQSGVAIDFSSDVVIMIVAENGTSVEYVVKTPARVTTSVLAFGFEGWESVAGSFLSYAYDKPKPTEVLATSTEGVAMLKIMQVSLTEMPVSKSTDAKSGSYAAKLVTLDTSSKTSSLIPALTAGSLYTGTFELNLTEGVDRLAATKFGVPYDKEPLYLKGWYKYIPGEKFINGEGATKPEEVKVVEGAIDECSIMAVLYETTLDEKGNNIPLTGHDINTSDRRVAVAQLADGSAKADWESFKIPFQNLEGKKYEAGKDYQIAIVCSSSKKGDLFVGAGGSTLFIDDLEVIGK